MQKFSEIRTYITPEQCREAATFLGDREKLIQFFIASYNDYVKLHSEANLSVITNPDALFRTKSEEDKLVFELVQYIRDVVGLPHKEEVYRIGDAQHGYGLTTGTPRMAQKKKEVSDSGNNRSQTTKAKTTKNPR